MRYCLIIFLLCFFISCAKTETDQDSRLNCKNVNVSDTMTRTQLSCYLHRSITMSDLFHNIYDFQSQLSFIETIKPLFLGRTLFVFGFENQLPTRLDSAKSKIQEIHSIDPDIICQAAIFEIVSREVETIFIPSWVFQYFNIEPEDRTFNYDAMLFPSGSDEIDFWYTDASVPDLTNRETQMWYLFLAGKYIDAGIEAIHLGQIEWVASRDSDKSAVTQLVKNIRHYASENARRGLVLLDGHSHGLEKDGYLALDFHSYPLRLFQDSKSPVGTTISSDWHDSIYTKSRGGIHPLGWNCLHNLFLVEFDHGYSQGSIALNTGFEFIDGLDEITWFAIQIEEDRNKILWSLWLRVKALDNNGIVEMPGARPIYTSYEEYPEDWYFGHGTDIDFSSGYNQTETIKAIWDSYTIYY
mgnify:CR=1 FL=1